MGAKRCYIKTDLGIKCKQTTPFPPFPAHWPEAPNTPKTAQSVKESMQWSSILKIKILLLKIILNLGANKSPLKINMRGE